MRRQFCDQRRLTLLFAIVLAAFLFTAGQSALAQQKVKTALDSLSKQKDKDSRIIINTDLVSFTVTVTDNRGRLVPGLERRAFAVYENDVRQEISFFSNRDAPASIGVVFDISASMREEKIIRAREALARFIQTSHPEDEYSLISFNDSTELLLDKTRDSQGLLAQFGRIKPEGNTALFDAVAVGLETIARSRYAKRALIVISDGEDNRSRTTLSQVKRKLQESDVTSYSILIGPLLPRSNGESVMNQLASASGGKLFYPGNGEAMSEAFEQIALELRQQYSIGFIPTNNTNDGRWRHLKITVTPPAGTPHLSVRSRKGYYAPPNPEARNRSAVRVRCSIACTAYANLIDRRVPMAYSTLSLSCNDKKGDINYSFVSQANQGFSAKD